MRNYEFTTNWFDANVQIWNVLIPQLSPKKILEIGSYEGKSTCYLIESCSLNYPIEIHCVDSWLGGVEHQNGGNMKDVESRFKKNIEIAIENSKNKITIEIHKGSSVYCLAKLLANQISKFDLIYVDGSHEASDVLVDAVNAYHLLKKNGLIIFDDYLWHEEPQGSQDVLRMPKIAIDAFVNIFQRKIRVLNDVPIRQLFIEKLVD
jgi:predicted O-methyltransferase YrrM